MARPLRIHPPGGYHHVTARGNDRLPIFLDDEDRWSFLRLLAEARERFGCDFHAYCLMTNHVHLVIEDHEGNLSKALRHIKGVHAQRFNRRHDRVGHLFEGRFWNSLLGDDAYVTTAVEYVHRNPVDAGIVASAADYTWSSYPAYLDKAVPPTCLTLGTILQMHGGRETLKRRTEGPMIACALLDEFRQERRPPVLGSEEFRSATLSTTESAEATQASSRRCLTTPNKPPLANIRDAVADEWGVDAIDLCASRQGYKNTPRAVAVHLSRAAGWPLGEVAAFFGLNSASAVSALSGRLTKQSSREPELHTRINLVQLVLVGT